MCRSLTTTSTQLLNSLHDRANQVVWMDLDARFKPIIHGMALRLGLSPEDAADVAQAAMTDFVRDYRLGKYQRGKGRLRTWLKSIARHRAIDLLRARARRNEQAAELDLVEPTEEAAQHAWDAEEDRAILHAALAELRDTTRSEPQTFQAFELTALRGMTSEAAAHECGMNTAQVRVAKHRLTEQLRTLVERITAAYQTDD